VCGITLLATLRVFTTIDNVVLLVRLFKSMRKMSYEPYIGEQNCENPLNYNLSKINKVSNRLNKRISSIVIEYNIIKYKMLWWELSKKKSWVTKIEMRRNKGHCVNR
jgi:hypothetical protein